MRRIGTLPALFPDNLGLVFASLSLRAENPEIQKIQPNLHTQKPSGTQSLQALMDTQTPSSKGFSPKFQNGAIERFFQCAD